MPITVEIGPEGIIMQERHSSRGYERPGKGHSRLDAIGDYVAFDLETTGLDPQYDQIIECAAIRYRNGEKADEYVSLVNPGIEIDDFITELTGITNEMLSTAPSMDVVLPKLLEFIGHDIIVGHNVSFDVNFVYEGKKRLYDQPFENDYIDTMRFSRCIWPEWPHHRLRDLRENLLGIKEGPAHRGAIDAEQTAQCFEIMKQYCRDKGIDISYLAGKHRFRAADITTEKSEFNPDSPIFGKMFVFTGTLLNFTRKEAMQAVVDRGGSCGDRVTAQTNFLVLGAQDYAKVGKSGKSSKQRKAEQLELAGNDIKTISENVFCEMLEE